MSIPIPNIDNTIILHGDGLRQASRSQSKRDIVAIVKMHFNEPSDIDIRKDIAAVNNKRSVTDECLRIFNAAPRFEQLRFMDET